MYPTRFSPQLSSELERLGVPFSMDPQVCRAAGRDLWAIGAILDYFQKSRDDSCAAVVFPATTEEVQTVIRWAVSGHHPLVPRGGGTGLSGAAWVDRPDAVVMDLTRLKNGFVLDGQRRTVQVPAGMTGQAMEHRLNAQGFTTGHQPSSAGQATVGGFLATRASGPFSGHVGKIEDIVRSVDWVDGTGRTHTSTGPGGEIDLVLGCEGTLGIFTSAHLAVRPLPEHIAMRSALFDSLHAALDAMRRIVQAGLAPAFLRLYDPSSAIHALRGSGNQSTGRSWLELGTPVAHLGHRTLPWVLRAAPLWNRLIQDSLPKLWKSRFLLLAGSAMERTAAELCASEMQQVMSASGGRDLGQEPAMRWWKHRKSLFSIRPRVFASGAFADAMEVCTSWSRVPELVQAVLDELRPHAFVMTHFSHAYHDGCSIHFTFAGAGRSREDTLSRYRYVWNLALTTAARHQATISHHHGIGKLKRDFFASEHGSAVPSLLDLKKNLDPHGILNPGTLWPI